MKLELVKVRLCPSCSEKLFHYKVKEMRRKEAKEVKAIPAGGRSGDGGNASRSRDVDSDRTNDRDRGSGKKRKVEE